MKMLPRTMSMIIKKKQKKTVKHGIQIIKKEKGMSRNVNKKYIEHGIQNENVYHELVSSHKQE